MESTASFGLILVLKLVQSRPGWGGRGVWWVSSPATVKASVVLFSTVSLVKVGAYSVKRSELRTVLDGEFDWGGTSVKR